MTTETPWLWYNERAAAVAEQYEELNAADVHAWLTDLLPAPSAVILDVGAGSGRDAAWLAGLGHEVVAVEPSAALRTEAISRDDHPRVRWLSDQLPSLKATHRLGLGFDVILLSAVWMHVPPTDRARAFRKLITLFKPRGMLAVTLRQRPADPERGFHPVAASELEQLARQHGAFIERCIRASDQLGRQEVTWIQMAIRLPDDGTGALPLLRQVILNDDKSSTYKLALLRALCRIADGSAGLARDDGDDAVSVPLGLVGLYWLRLYLPLLRENLPQSPTPVGLSRLGFVREPFRALMSVMAQQDLRIGMSFGESTGQALHEALRDACDTIVRMPAHFMTYPGGSQIFPVVRLPRIRTPNPVVISRPYLASFGELRIPRALWQALQRFTVWVEPALVTEWIRLTKSYAERQHRVLDDAALQRAMVWSEPPRAGCRYRPPACHGDARRNPAAVRVEREAPVREDLRH